MVLMTIGKHGRVELLQYNSAYNGSNDNGLN